MRITKNQRHHWLAGGLVGLSLFLSACSPPGPKALLKAEKLIAEGKYPQAVKKLERVSVLMDKKAPYWNFLGLAYQGTGELEKAIRAYASALALDERYATVHFNLGSLYLDQNNLAAAVEELNKYILMTKPASHPDAWIKLGNAYLRLNRFDYAEMSFQEARKTAPRHPQALNSLGIVMRRTNRPREATQFFTEALKDNPKFGAALLNLAVVLHQDLGQKPAALERYREYVSLKPKPPHLEQVTAIIKDLQAELSPKPKSTPSVPPRPPTPAPTNSANLSSNSITRIPLPPTNTVMTNTSAPKTNTLLSSKTNLAIAKAETNKSGRVTTPSRTTATKSPTPPKRTNNPVQIAKATPRVPEAPKLTTLTNEEVVVRPRETNAPPAEITATTPTVSPEKTNELPLPDLTKKPLRPLIPFPRTTPLQDLSALPPPLPPVPPVTSTSPPETTVPGSRPETTTTTIAKNVENSERRETSKKTFKRYSYRNPKKGSPGNRAEADRAFDEGFAAAKAGRFIAAREAYKKATEVDPTYFEAYVNLGNTYIELGDYSSALESFERALVVDEANSTKARYNFAMALKHAGYFADAARELDKVLKQTPSDTRAHLNLANLYSQQLDETEEARRHYQKVLELDPQNAQAPLIRSWLQDHPGTGR